MARWIAGLGVLVLLGSTLTAACSSDSGGGTAGGGGGGSGGVGGSGGNKDAGKDSASDAPNDAPGDAPGDAPSESAAPTCTDGVKNGNETGVDCGGSCPASYHGFGCVSGTAGSQVCSSFPNDGGTPDVDDAGAELFDVTISWNAAGGNAYVDYVLIYGSGGITYNSTGIAGGSPNNICTSGPYSESFKLPLGDKYTYKIWHAYCVKTNACSGCGSDTVVAEGGPFGIAKDVCK